MAHSPRNLNRPRITVSVATMYTGDSTPALKQLSHNAVQVMHMNDYPDIPRGEINDSDRVYPGDGVCPLTETIRDMVGAGIEPIFSLELFNKEYWAQDPHQVAKTGLEKMKTTVAKALA